MKDLLAAVQAEVHHHVTATIHPPVALLVGAFTKHLKEPRYQAPLTISELSRLFHHFYQDLNSLVIHTYTQSNSAKRQLLAQLEFFNGEPARFDYLLAISKHNPGLSKRTDPDALLQLRVFNFYKFLVIFETIEHAQYLLFKTSNKKDDIGSEALLYDSVFRFDERDLILQSFLDEKLRLLRDLHLPFDVFSDAHNEETARLGAFFAEVSPNHPTVVKIVKKFSHLGHNITPYSKLKCIVKIQKYIISLLAEVFELLSISNDLLLPSLIYVIVTFSPPECDLHLNLMFVQNFLNRIDPYAVNATTFTSSSSVYAYVPTNRSRRAPTKNPLSTNLFELLNLDELAAPAPQQLNRDVAFFDNDKHLIEHISAHFLNTGELEYYLTNFEAVLFYLSNVTTPELVPEITRGERLLNFPLHKLVDEELASKFEFPTTSIEKATQQELHENRLRLSSLINTISTRLNDAASLVNRLRSNLNLLKKEAEPETDFEALLMVHDDTTSMMRTILGKLGSVQLRPSEPDEPESKHRRLSSLIGRMDPARTRSSSLDQKEKPLEKRNSITSKLTSGVTEFMTKYSQPPPQNQSNVSLHSLEDRPDYARQRTTSLQIMDKWFNNLLSQQADNTSTPELLFSDNISEVTKYHNVSFDTLTVADLRTLKQLYDQLCDEVKSLKTSVASEDEDVKL